MLDVLRYNIDMSDNISGVESGAARDGNPRRLLCDDGMLSAADKKADESIDSIYRIRGVVMKEPAALSTLCYMEKD